MMIYREMMNLIQIFNPATPQPVLLEKNKQSSIHGKSQDRKAQEAKYFSVEWASPIDYTEKPVV